MLEKTLESPLDCKEIQPVHSEGDQPRDFFGRNDAEAETPVLWPPHVKSWLIRKDFDAGRDWGQEGKGTTEDEMAGWHHRLNGRGSEWTPGDGDGQGGLACCDSWGCKESDMTEQLNWTELSAPQFILWEATPGLVVSGWYSKRLTPDNAKQLKICLESYIISLLHNLLIKASLRATPDSRRWGNRLPLWTGRVAESHCKGHAYLDAGFCGHQQSTLYYL